MPINTRRKGMEWDVREGQSNRERVFWIERTVWTQSRHWILTDQYRTYKVPQKGHGLVSEPWEG